MGRQDPIFVNDFIGGLNSRDIGHLIANNEATQLDAGWFPNKALRSFPGDRRRLLDPIKYPPIAGMSGGTAGGVPNNEPILGGARYYCDQGAAADVRVHGNTVEYWADGSGEWVRIGNLNWPNGAVATFCQFRNMMLIMHGTLNTYYMCKFLTYNGTTWVAGDVPIPGFYTLGAVAFTGGGLDDMTAAAAYTGNENRFYLVEVERNPIGPVTFYGGGIDDAVSGGVYTGTDSIRYVVEILGVGVNDTFRWSDDGGLTWSPDTLITGVAQAMSNGVTITFGAVGGHTVGDFWDIYCSTQDGMRWSQDGGASWVEEHIPITGGVPIGLAEGVSVTFAAGVGHTVGEYWEFNIIVNGLPGLRPAFAVAYKNRVYTVSPNEPDRLRYSAIDNPRDFLYPGGGYVSIGEEKGDPMAGLFVHNGRLFVFKKHSVWIYWIDDYNVQHIYQHRASGGLISPNCICAFDDIVYYVTNRGAYMIYGADYDCVSDKVHPSIQANPEFLEYAHAIVHQPSATIWITYLVNIENVVVSESDGDETIDILHTHTWVGQIRRGLKTHPRWTLLRYHRITSYTMPPGDNNYRGNDAQNLKFNAQQPDKTEWNPNEAYPDALYPTTAQGGPRHYSYIWNTSFDRDQIPAMIGLYNGDRGIGWHFLYRSRRFMLVPTSRNVLFDQMRLDYNVWKNQKQTGFDAGWGRFFVDEETLLAGDDAAPTGDDHFPLTDATPFNPGEGGWCFMEWSLCERTRTYHRGPGAYGKTFQLEIEACGTANRSRYSHAFEFKDFAVEWDIPETDMTTETR